MNNLTRYMKDALKIAVPLWLLVTLFPIDKFGRHSFLITMDYDINFSKLLLYYILSFLISFLIVQGYEKIKLTPLMIKVRRQKKKIILGSLSLLLLLSMPGIASIFFDISSVWDRITRSKMIELGGIKLGATKQDVVFLKGSPKYPQKYEDNIWEIDEVDVTGYFSKLYKYNTIKFKKGTVNIVGYRGSYSSTPEIYGRNLMGYSSESLIEFLGSPSMKRYVDKGYYALYIFMNLNLYFVLAQNHVYRIGIYDAEKASTQIPIEWNGRTWYYK